MTAVISLLVVLVLSLLTTRVGTVALVHTGLSRETARFQARSAFTGVGFTTSESEKVVDHPVRRRILLLLMLLGNAGVVAAVSSLVLSVIEAEAGGSMVQTVAVLVGGLAALWAVARSRWVERALARAISAMLRRFTKLDARDYASLLHLAGDYRVTELSVRDGDWLEDRTLSELGLRDEGVVVLGVQRRGGAYVGAPQGDTKLTRGDTLLVYGRQNALEALDERRKGRGGDREHEDAVRAQEDLERAEHEEDEAGARRHEAQERFEQAAEEVESLRHES